MHKPPLSQRAFLENTLSLLAPIHKPFDIHIDVPFLCKNKMHPAVSFDLRSPELANLAQQLYKGIRHITPLIFDTEKAKARLANFRPHLSVESKLPEDEVQMVLEKA